MDEHVVKRVAKEHVGTCAVCGAEFTYLRGQSYSRRYCPKCRAVKKRQDIRAKQALDREADKAVMASADECAWDYCTAEDIRYAKERPSGCSVQRWRIELRRRANAGLYDLCGDGCE